MEGKKVSKKTRRGTGLFKEKVFRFLWGCSKNYIMYWGVTSIIIAYEFGKVCTKIEKYEKLFCAKHTFPVYRWTKLPRVHP